MEKKIEKLLEKIKDTYSMFLQCLNCNWRGSIACPFCGSAAEIENTHTPSYWVECTECGCQMSDQLSHDLYDDIPTHMVSITNACKAWNTRISVAKAKRLMLT